MSSNNYSMYNAYQNPAYLSYVAGINSGSQQFNFATYSPSTGLSIRTTSYNTGADLNGYNTRSTNSSSYGSSSSYSTSGGSYGGRR